MYRLYWRDSYFNGQIARRRIVVTDTIGLQEVPLLKLNLGLNGQFKLHWLLLDDEMPEHLRRIGSTQEFKDVAGSFGEQAIYSVYNRFAERTTDHATFEGESAAANRLTVSEIDEFLTQYDLGHDTLTGAKNYVDTELAHAEEMFHNGNYVEAKASTDRIKGSLMRHSRADIQAYISRGVKGKVYAPFDGLNEESRTELIKYVSAKMAELKRRLTGEPALVS